MATKTILRREDVEVRENFKQADSQFEIYIENL